MHVRTVSGSLEAVSRVMVRCEDFDLVIAFLEIKGRIHYVLLVLHEESIYSQMREQVARYALAHIGGAESVRQCLWGRSSAHQCPGLGE